MAEVAGGRYDWLAEKPAPKAIDHHARSERIISTRDRGRQFLATASVFERDWFDAGEHAQKSPLEHRSFAFHIAAHEDIEVIGFGIFHHEQIVRRHIVCSALSNES